LSVERYLIRISGPGTSDIRNTMIPGVKPAFIARISKESKYVAGFGEHEQDVFRILLICFAVRPKANHEEMIVGEVSFIRSKGIMEAKIIEGKAKESDDRVLRHMEHTIRRLI
jgi:hypothetical protein